jgi:hypothetical protein
MPRGVALDDLWLHHRVAAQPAPLLDLGVTRTDGVWTIA